MSPYEHYCEAEELLELSHAPGYTSADRNNMQQEAQVHAILACANSAYAHRPPIFPMTHRTRSQESGEDSQ